MEDFIYQYFIKPIWEKSGYNPVNTAVYVAIALVALYFINKYLKREKLLNESFIKGVLFFVLFGSTMRVVTDAVDNGVFEAITPLHQLLLSSGIYDYGYITVSPGIYILTAFLLFASLIILKRIGKGEELWKVGALLWVFHLSLLLPFLKYTNYGLLVFVLAFLPFIAALYFIKDRLYSGMVGAQALDGAATFVAIDIFSKQEGIRYFEQHVLSAFIGSLGGYWVFYLLKVALAVAAYYALKEEKMAEEDKRFIALVIIIIGLAPGMRDVLRMMIGA